MMTDDEEDELERVTEMRVSRLVDRAESAEANVARLRREIKDLRARAILDLPGMTPGFSYSRGDIVDAERARHKKVEQEYYDACKKLQKENTELTEENIAWQAELDRRNVTFRGLGKAAGVPESADAHEMGEALLALIKQLKKTIDEK